MLLVQALQKILKHPERKRAAGFFVWQVLMGALSCLLMDITEREIRCFSDEPIRMAAYSGAPTETPAITVWRADMAPAGKNDSVPRIHSPPSARSGAMAGAPAQTRLQEGKRRPEKQNVLHRFTLSHWINCQNVPHQHNTILLTGADTPAVRDILEAIRKKALGLPNRTKECVIKVPRPKSVLGYFLVLEVEASDDGPVLVVENRGWMPNSDVLALFAERMRITTRSPVSGLIWTRPFFNSVIIQCRKDALEEVEEALWCLNNMYSHLLGEYFYWVIRGRAVFLSSLAPLLVVIGALLLFSGCFFGEGSNGGSFFCTEKNTRAAAGMCLIACVCCFPFVLLVIPFFLDLPYLDAFVFFSVMVPIHFPVAIVFGLVSLGIPGGFQRSRIYAGLPSALSFLHGSP